MVRLAIACDEFHASASQSPLEEIEREGILNLLKVLREEP
jgi:hypothetical protein